MNAAPLSVVSLDSELLAEPASCLLVVDDSDRLAELIQHVLRTHFPYQILLASSGREGVELARKFQPKAIVLDWILPDIHGDEVCRRLLEDPTTAGIPVVLMSGQNPQWDQFELPNLNVFLAKPFLMAALVETVKNVLPVPPAS